MKKIYTLVFFVILFGVLKGQIVDGINYQAVAIDADGYEIAGMDIYGNPIEEKAINVRFTIISDAIDGDIKYQETHNTNTDINGLFSLVIGDGTKTELSPASSIINVDWGASKHFLKVELDIEQSNEFKLMGVQQMMAVPYALYALNASNVIGNTNGEVDTSFTNEIQNLSISNDTLYLSEGGSVVLPFTEELDADTTNELQFLSISNDTIYLTNGGFVVLPHAESLDNDTTNEIQTISREGLTVSLSDNGGSFQDSINVYTAGDGIEIINNVISTNQTNSSSHYIGEFYGGGIIFYLEPDGQHGLIASLEDLSTGMQWSNITDVAIGAAAQSPWDGLSNSLSIVAQEGHTTSGAQLCLDYEHDGFDDWYLPSVLELTLLYNSAYIISKILVNDNNWQTHPIIFQPLVRYMSSTETYDDNDSFLFAYTLVGAGSKSGAFWRVRAIRSF